MLGFSFMATLLITLFFLVNNYNTEISTIHKSMLETFDTKQAALASSLWNLDSEMTLVQLEGIIRSPSINLAEILIGDKSVYRAGEAPESQVLMKEFPLTHQIEGGSVYPMGTLRLKTGLNHVVSHILNNLWSTLIWQLFEKGLMVLVVYILLSKVVVSKIKHFSDYFETLDEHSLHHPLDLKTPPGSKKNELDLVAEKVNTMRENLLDSFEARIAAQQKLQENSQVIHRQMVQLESQNAELERFTYTVSHDLKSPLITIQGFAQYLFDDMRNNNLERAELDLVKIKGAVEKMNHLLKDLLELSRVGKVVSELQEFEMKIPLQEALELLEISLKTEKVKINITDMNHLVVADKLRIREVWQNLIENALKYRLKDRELKLEIGSRIVSGKTAFYIKDNGIGIEKEYLDKIFGLFEKLNKDTQGTGIGLALVKRIIYLHGGQLWAESPGSGQGSTFFFTLN